MANPETAPVYNADEWSAGATNYADKLEPFTFQFGSESLRLLAPVAGERLIDIACGSGLLAIHAATEYGVEVDAIDFSTSMPQLVEHRLAAVSDAAIVRTHVMDGTALDFLKGTFDAAISCFGIFLFEDFQKGLREMHRVLKPGGGAAVVCWCPPHETALQPWYEMIGQECPELGELKRPKGWTSMETSEGMTQELTRVGFGDVSVERVCLPFKCPSATEFCQILAANPFGKTTLENFSDGRQEELKAAFIKLLESRYGTGAFEIAATALVGLGTKR